MVFLLWGILNKRRSRQNSIRMCSLHIMMATVPLSCSLSKAGPRPPQTSMLAAMLANGWWSLLVWKSQMQTPFLSPGVGTMMPSPLQGSWEHGRLS